MKQNLSGMPDIFLIFVIVLFVLGQWFDSWALFSYDFANENILSSIKLGLTLAGFTAVHFMARGFSARLIARKIDTNIEIDKNLAGEYREGKILCNWRSGFRIFA